MGSYRALIVLAALVALAGCGKDDKAVSAAGEAQPIPTSATAGAPPTPIEAALDQNWTAANRAVWYERSQGSRLIPLSWLLALEDKDGKPLLSEDNVKRWGYLPHVNSHGRALPIGFTEDQTPDPQLPQPVTTWRKVPTADDRIWVGMNCSACHTAQLTYKTQAITVDGGPALSDFEGFLRDLRAALNATVADDARFGRFADRVLGDTPLQPFKPGLHPVDAVKDLLTKNDSDDPENRGRLRAALRTVAAHEAELKRLNASSGASDYGRLDAFGHIFNKVALIAETPQTPQTPSPSDAPVSYPFLWNVPQHDRVQWNGIAPNKLPKNVPDDLALLPLLRNTGEVIGVFADIKVDRAPHGFPSSIDINGLKALEAQLRPLRPPAWPDKVFGWGEFRRPDGTVADHTQLVADGAKLYGAPGKPGLCIDCHQLLPNGRTDLKSPIVAQMAMFNPKSQVKPSDHESTETDIAMACNAYVKTALSGRMRGQLTDKLKPLGEREGVAVLLKHSVLRALAERQVQASGPAQNLLFRGHAQSVLALFAGAGAAHGGKTPAERCLNEANENLGYKGRPLNGIWATAPYLHNGSVRTLYQLLLPPGQREPAFEVGGREFDPNDVGYENTAGPNRSTLTTAAPGNANTGHNYGSDTLSEYDRRALIEFLKTL